MSLYYFAISIPIFHQLYMKCNIFYFEEDENENKGYKEDEDLNETEDRGRAYL